MPSLAAKNHYDVLGVQRHASEVQIKDAYRALVKKWHPDVCHKPEAESRFKELQKAIAVLGDRIARNNYDNDLLSIEATGLPRDPMDSMLERSGAMSGTPPIRRKKQKKGSKHKRAHVYEDEIPDGFDDTSLDEILPGS